MGMETTQARKQPNDGLVGFAWRIAKDAHKGQMYGLLSYLVHLQEVVDILEGFGYDQPEVIAAAILHDVIEDGNVGELYIRRHCGHVVADLVVAVTDESGRNRKERKILTYPKIRRAGKWAVAIKLADRIANTLSCIRGRNPLLKMYKHEFPEFSAALFESDECDAMWDRLREISA